jgi:deoxyadenosine/deoxycytidine kinase
VKQAPLIAVSGNLGAGKTTLVNLLKQELGWEIASEAFADLAYVADFHRECSKWAFHNQLDIVIRKGEEQNPENIHEIPFVQDRTLTECSAIFAQKFYEDGYISERDFNCLSRATRVFTRFVRQPDLYLFLDAPVRVLRARVQQRSRGLEPVAALPWIEDLSCRYEKWIHSIPKDKVVRLNTSTTDFRIDEKARNELFDCIASKLSEFQVPLPHQKWKRAH